MSPIPRTAWTVAAVSGLALAVPAAAQAATKRVFVGLPPAYQKATGDTIEVNAFFPSNISIHAGDFVAFVPAPQGVDIPSGRQELPVDATGRKVSNVNDAAETPFWFNGADELSFTKGVFKSNYGKTFVKGSTRIESGLGLRPNLKPMKVRFNRPGLYSYYSQIKPGVKGTVRVVGKRSPIPSAKSDAKRVKSQISNALAVAKTLPNETKPAANTVSVGAEGKGGVHVADMFPKILTVPAGTTVNFLMPKGSTDVHTATFGPGPATDANSYVGGLAASLRGQAPFDPRAIYPSEQPGSLPTEITPALHGNGFWNTGIMDTVVASLRPPSGKVTFATPGTYEYVCLIHPTMKGTISVQ